MKKEELEKLIDAKTAEKSKEYADNVKKELEEKHAKELEEIRKSNDEKIKLEIEKAEANRRSIDETGLNVFGENATDKEIVEAKLEKSEKYDGIKLNDFEKEFQKRHDHAAIMRYIMKKSAGDGYNERDFINSKTWKKFAHLCKQSKLFKAFDEGTGTGAEWQPTVLSSRLIEYVEASGDFAIANEFERIMMASSTFNIPREDGTVTAHKGSIGGTPTESSSPTEDTTFTAQKIIGHTKVYYEAQEDMIISAIPFIENRLVRSIARGTTDAIINGDNSTTHMDANVTLATDRRKLWKGLRKKCQANSWTYNVAGAWTQEKFRKFQNEVDVAFMTEFNDLLFIFGKDSYNQIRNLTEVRTAEKYLNNATVIRGVLQDIDGIKIDLTSLLSDSINAAGVVSSTSSDNVKGQALIVYKPAFALGMKRSLMLETDKNILTQHIDVVASMRLDFQSLIKTTVTGDRKCVVQARNITPWS